MGCGKTVLGKCLAKRKSLDFIDLDEFIETEENTSISKLFEKVGVLHYSVNSIKNFLKKNNLEDWWSNNKLQEVRQEFLNEFFNIKKNHDKNLFKYILKI